MRTMFLIARFHRFRAELGTLWRAFRDPLTPLWLKVAMLAVPGYLFLPVDIIPDFIPIAGLLDDVIIIPMIVSWLVSRVPQRVDIRAEAGGSQTIDGTWRRR